ncbi:hypothetical protein SGFS_058910 [Streptomyces graminofaciens]|uniref:PDZ domain-containing protein n=1 Tax=Streptomyces graminofaciens TaxID=68212 RepID=A0ABN5VMD9_9ACTN|nr:trypsin-like peptidase domain-containing protein [Streptomyces graminofaciens]BBC34597.1 hypothetical protein SGFS_058910 [Streptomyces graminofaciens]
MSTENEGTAVPPAPSAPPVPVETPAASAPAPAAAPAPTPAPAPIAEENAPTAQLPPVPPAEPHPELVGAGAPAYAGATGQGPEPAYAQPAGPGPGPEPVYAAPGGPGPEPAYAAPAGQGPHPGGYAQHPVGPSAPEGGWPPPPPPGTPSYADAGAAAGPGAAAGGGGWGSSYQQQTQQPAPKPGGRRGGLIAAVLVAALVAGGVGGGLGYTLADRNDDSTGSTTISASQQGGDLKRDAGTVAGVAASALPSTVTIQAESSDGEGGTGTGFVFDKEGHIVTNNHVVADAVDGGKLSATFPNGKKYDAEVVGHAQGYDVAVIKLKNAPSDLNPLPLGDSDKVAVGDSTIAIGAPFGLSNTVTTGIISAKNRPVASSDGSSSSKASYMSALQTDASINPGNSGGPLLDAKGNVIGINSAIQSASSGGLGSGQSGSIGLGFAIPINQAKNVAQQLIRTGKPVYPVIGASVSLDEGVGGAKITSDGGVTAGGPADKAGLKSGDVITKLDDTVVDSGPTLIGEIWTHQPGDKVTLTYTRDGKTRTADVTLGEREGDS